MVGFATSSATSPSSHPDQVPEAHLNGLFAICQLPKFWENTESTFLHALLHVETSVIVGNGRLSARFPVEPGASAIRQFWQITDTASQGEVRHYQRFLGLLAHLILQFLPAERSLTLRSELQCPCQHYLPVGGVIREEAFEILDTFKWSSAWSSCISHERGQQRQALLSFPLFVLNPILLLSC